MEKRGVSLSLPPQSSEKWPFPSTTPALLLWKAGLLCIVELEMQVWEIFWTLNHIVDACGPRGKKLLP